MVKAVSPIRNIKKKRKQEPIIVGESFHVSCILWPYAHVKLDKIQQIIAHYSKKKLEEGNVVDLEHYKMWINDRKAK